MSRPGRRSAMSSSPSIIPTSALCRSGHTGAALHTRGRREAGRQCEGTELSGRGEDVLVGLHGLDGLHADRKQISVVKGTASAARGAECQDVARGRTGVVREYERATTGGPYRPTGKNRQGLGRLCARIHPRKRLSRGEPHLQAVG